MKDPSGSSVKTRVEQLEARVQRLERGRDSYGVETLLERIFPPEVRQRAWTAQREQLEIARRFIDRWLERTEPPKRAKPAQKRRTVRVRKGTTKLR